MVGGGWDGCAHIKHILWLQDQRVKDSCGSSFKTVRLRDRQMQREVGRARDQAGKNPDPALPGTVGSHRAARQV